MRIEGGAEYEEDSLGRGDGPGSSWFGATKRAGSSIRRARGKLISVTGTEGRNKWWSQCAERTLVVNQRVHFGIEGRQSVRAGACDTSVYE